MVHLNFALGNRFNSGTDPPLYSGTKSAITTVSCRAIHQTKWEGAESRMIRESEDLP